MVWERREGNCVCSMLSEFFCARSDRCVFLGAWSGLALVLSHAAVHGWIKYALNKWYVSYFPPRTASHVQDCALSNRAAN